MDKKNESKGKREQFNDVPFNEDIFSKLMKRALEYDPKKDKKKK